MIYVLVLFAVLAALLLINNPKNKDTYRFIFIIFSFSLVAVFDTIAASKTISYQYTGNPLYALDYRIFTKLSSRKLSYYFLIHISSVCCILYTAACSFFSFGYMMPHLKKYRIFSTVISCALYLLFNNPSLNTRIYQLIFYHGLPLDLLRAFSLMRNISCILLIADAFVNNIILFGYCRGTSVWLKKWQINSYNIYQLSLNMLFSVFIIQDTVWSFDTGLLAEKALSFSRKSYFMSGNSYILLGLIILFVSVFMLFSVFHYKTFGSMIKLKGFFLNRSAQKTKKQLRTYFHSFKNHLLTVESLADQGLSAGTAAQKDEMFRKIKTLSENSMANISAMLDSFNSVDLDENDDDIISCIETAIIGSDIPPDIRITKHYSTNPRMLTFDYFHITEMFKNIFRNAADAITASGRTDGEIAVYINSDKDIFEVSIRDNGTGMSAKTKRRMFRPLYTTKVKKNYWGVGMFYVHNVVSSHGGFIRVLSTPGKGTQISIFFPCRQGF